MLFRSLAARNRNGGGGMGVCQAELKESLLPSTSARVCRDGGRGADRDPILIAGRVGAQRCVVGCLSGDGARAKDGAG